MRRFRNNMEIRKKLIHEIAGRSANFCKDISNGINRSEVEKVRHPGILDARKFLKNQHLAESFWPYPLPIHLPMIKQVTKAFGFVLTSTFFNTKKELSIETDRIFAESFWPEHQDARNTFNFFHLCPGVRIELSPSKYYRQDI